MKNNIGIYALYWWNQDLVYVGLSQDLASRGREHILDMKANRHSNYKVQDAFNKFGTPDFILLEYCSISELCDKEIYWTNEFDALNTGLCLVQPGVVGFGPFSNASKYSKLQILKVFRYLYLTKYTYIKISQMTGVHTNTVGDIRSGNSHLWLRDRYPKQYRSMTSKDRSNNSLSIKAEPTLLIDPYNVVHECHNIRDFCRKNSLINTCLGEVIRGTRKSHKGWKRYTQDTQPTEVSVGFFGFTILIGAKPLNL